MRMNQIGLAPASVNEDPYKDLDDVNEFDLRKYQVKVKAEKEQIQRGYSRVQERVKSLRQKFSIYLKLSYFNPGWNFSYNCNFFRRDIPS